MFKNSKILLTGGTGSFGKKFIEMTLKKNVKKIIIYSRDEMKQWNLQNYFRNNQRLEFVLGDVRDKERLYNICNNIDFLVHAAATKIIPIAELNPLECIKTNVIGAANVIDVAREKKIKKVVALSTDKASSPINLYGSAKLAADKLFVASNLNEKKTTAFSIVRYGNVMGSRGSIIPFLLSQKNFFPITDKNMTRFMITLEEAVKLVWFAFKDMVGGEIYIKKIPTMNILDIARSINSKMKIKYIGIRPGEKIHEQMIGTEDSPYAYEYKDYYKILPSINNWNRDKKRIKNGKKVKNNFSYSSNNKSNILKISELRHWINQNKDQLI